MNGAIWNHHGKKLGPVVRERIREELRAARERFKDLPEGVAFLHASEQKWREAEATVRAFAAEPINGDTRAQRFLDGVGEFVPRSTREEKRALPSEFVEEKAKKARNS